MWWTAFENKKEAEKRESETVTALNELKSDIRILAETMREGFARVDKRFEAVDQRFEIMQKSIDQRFDAVDKRFEAMQHYMDKRFGVVDKRFESMQESMNQRFEVVDKRFEDMNKRFTMLMWFTGVLLTIGIAVIKFI